MRRFATTPQVGSHGLTRARTGSVAAWATTAITTASPTAWAIGLMPPPSCFNHPVKPRPAVRIPTVASVDSAKPRETALHGSISKVPAVTANRSPSGCPPLPSIKPHAASAPMPTARSTAGCGPTTTTIVAKKHQVATALIRRRPGSSTEMTDSEIAMWEPETAVRWVSEVVSIASFVSLLSPRSSPIAIPPINGPADPALASLIWDRVDFRFATNRCHRGADSISCTPEARRYPSAGGPGLPSVSSVPCSRKTVPLTNRAPPRSPLATLT